MTNIVRFDARDLDDVAQPVEPQDLRNGETYFSLTFEDDNLCVPHMEPVVFIGRNLEPGDVDRVYFQDFDSFRRGIPYGFGDPVTSSNNQSADFFAGAEDETNHIFEFDKALDVLLICSVRRRRVRR